MIRENNILVSTAMYNVLESTLKLERLTSDSVSAVLDAFKTRHYDIEMLNRAVEKWYNLKVIFLSVDTINHRVIITLSDDSKHYEDWT